MPRPPRRIAALVLAALTMLAGGVPAPAAVGDDRHVPAAEAPADLPRWRWPVAGAVIERGYEAPASRWGPGHRGIDLRVGIGAAVGAPADGVVAFSGRVVDRGVLTIDHGGGIVSTLEPVEQAVPAGTVVAAGEIVARVATGGHAAPGALHLGARRDGEYLDPRLLLGVAERAVLLPCC